MNITLKEYFREMKTCKNIVINNKNNDLLVHVDNEKLEQNKNLIIAYLGNIKILFVEYKHNKIIFVLDTEKR